MRVLSLERPLPIRDLRCVDAELPGVIFTRDLLVEQGLASARSGDAEARHAVDCIDLGRLRAEGAAARPTRGSGKKGIFSYVSGTAPRTRSGTCVITHEARPTPEMPDK